MTDKPWKITFEIYRKKGDEPPHFQSFPIEADPDENVLDCIERIWGTVDRSLTFRHACHHSTCGACGMRVNGVEKLTCITSVRSVTQDGGTVRVEPLRNFPVTSDLVVDMSEFYLNMDLAKAAQVLPRSETWLGYEEPTPEGEPDYLRLVDCIECGMCISACPVAQTASEYLGPAVLAGAQQSYGCTGEAGLLDLADQKNGVWRCHSAFECTEVCPSHVDPGWRIMDLRKKIIGDRLSRIFKPKEK